MISTLVHLLYLITIRLLWILRSDDMISADALLYLLLVVHLTTDTYYY